MQSSPLPLSSFDTYSLLMSSLRCRALCMVISFLVLWLSSSLVHFTKGPEYLTKVTAQVFILLIRFLLDSFTPIVTDLWMDASLITSSGLFSVFSINRQILVLLSHCDFHLCWRARETVRFKRFEKVILIIRFFSESIANSEHWWWNKVRII